MSPALGASDRLELAALVVRYGLCFDAADGAAWAALFAPDGAFVGPNGVPVVGADALAALPPAALAATPGMKHFPGPLVLDLTDGAVRGRSYGQAVQLRAGNVLALVVAGEYDDTFVRVAGGWRFQERRFTAWAPPQG